MNPLEEWRRREKARERRLFWIAAISVGCLIVAIATVLSVIFSIVHV